MQKTAFWVIGRHPKMALNRGWDKIFEKNFFAIYMHGRYLGKVKKFQVGFVGSFFEKKVEGGPPRPHQGLRISNNHKFELYSFKCYQSMSSLQWPPMKLYLYFVKNSSIIIGEDDVTVGTNLQRWLFTLSPKFYSAISGKILFRSQTNLRNYIKEKYR